MASHLVVVDEVGRSPAGAVSIAMLGGPKSRRWSECGGNNL